MSGEKNELSHDLHLLLFAGHLIRCCGVLLTLPSSSLATSSRQFYSWSLAVKGLKRQRLTPTRPVKSYFYLAGEVRIFRNFYIYKESFRKVYNEDLYVSV
jgi:hypothetical protein